MTPVHGCNRRQATGRHRDGAAHGSVGQNFIFNGDWAIGTHTVTVNFQRRRAEQQPPTATFM
jgi:hypothetical protein